MSSAPAAHPAGDVHRALHLVRAAIDGVLMVLRFGLVLDHTRLHPRLLPRGRFQALITSRAGKGGAQVSRGAVFWWVREGLTAQTRFRQALPSCEGRAG